MAYKYTDVSLIDFFDPTQRKKDDLRVHIYGKVLYIVWVHNMYIAVVHAIAHAELSRHIF
jgi:hypothetical protein